MPHVTTDLRIHYRVSGAGPAVVWHTGGCGDGRMWELAGYLAALPGFTHVLMDHRGHGGSESPPDLEGHRMERYVADVVAVLDGLGLDRAAFVGYSLGGRVALALAATFPSRLTAVVALDAVPDPAESSDELRADAREVTTRGTVDMVTDFASEEQEPCPDWLLDHLCDTDPLAFAGGFEAQATEPDPWARAPSIAVPVLLLVGAATAPDDEWRLLGQRLADLLPRGELVVLPGVAHLAAFHRTDLTVPPLLRFLTAHAT